MAEEQQAKIRINLNDRELEIEGSESFIRTHEEVISKFLTLLQEEPAPPPAPENEAEEFKPKVVPSQGSLFPPRTNPLDSIPDTFGEFYQKASKNINDIDKILLGAFFVQHTNGSNMFTTREVSSILKEQGIHLTNPSHSIKLNLDANRIFLVKKGQFRISETGMDRMYSILR